MTITRPLDKVIVDQRTGRITLEWDTFFNTLQFYLNALVDAAANPGTPTPGALVNVQTFTASGTYTPSLGASQALVVCVGGGGGGGGCGALASGQHAGGGGASGGLAQHYISTGLEETTVTIGAAGTAGAAANYGTGGTGGDTSFGSLCIAKGGLGGPGSTNLNGILVPGGLGQTGGTGNVLVSAGNCGGSTTMAQGGTLSSMGGHGAGSSLGGGVLAPVAAGSNQVYAGVNGVGYGSGGSGAAGSNSGGAAAGGAGAAGICIVYEYA